MLQESSWGRRRTFAGSCRTLRVVPAGSLPRPLEFQPPFDNSWQLSAQGPYLQRGVHTYNLFFLVSVLVFILLARAKRSCLRGCCMVASGYFVRCPRLRLPGFLRAGQTQRFRKKGVLREAAWVPDKGSHRGHVGKLLLTVLCTASWPRLSGVVWRVAGSAV